MGSVVVVVFFFSLCHTEYHICLFPSFNLLSPSDPVSATPSAGTSPASRTPSYLSSSPREPESASRSPSYLSSSPLELAPSVEDPPVHPSSTTPTTPTTPPALPLHPNESSAHHVENAVDPGAHDLGGDGPGADYAGAVRPSADPASTTVVMNDPAPRGGEATPHQPGDAPPSYGDVEAVVVEMEIPDTRRERTTPLLPTYDEAMAANRC